MAGEHAPQPQIQSSSLLDCLKPLSRKKANAGAKTSSDPLHTTTANFGKTDIRLPAISSSQRIETAVLKASLAHASCGTVRPELMVSEGNILESVDICGDAIFAKQAEMVRAAKKEVVIRTFAWDPSSPGAKMILDALLDAAHSAKERESSSTGPHEPIRVRLLINEGTGLAQKFMRLTSANKNRSAPKRWPSHAEALVGNYKKSQDHKYAPLTKDVDFQVRVHQHYSSNSIHAKSVIVDGCKAAMTGANVQSRNHGETPAYDFGISMSGRVALGLRDDFVSAWNNAENPDQETTPLSKELGFSAESTTGAAGKGLKIALLTRRPDWNILNQNNRNPQDKAFLAAIGTAQESIQVMTPNFNAPSAIEALAQAANRGVKVQILVSKGFNDERVDNVIAGGTNDKAISKLAALVKNKEFLDVRYFKNPMNPEKPVPHGNTNGNGASHAKFMSIDNALVILGSANMDKTSWHFSGEMNAALFDAGATRRIKSSVFDPAWEVSQAFS
ncbi:phosphatidylserine/phosphatidylglycerophosphate/cardiolipin synthase family protein [Xanthomonas cerealis pv. cerealis]|uniref:Phosphatidylserine/phosphatidylglycerophosphate/ cardiolipin synthase family protein n=1 Tax=Xanthomonas cerealis pv. cerealis TaxID=152263 RepID=A0A514E9P1_9XANT|nr:phosphatidylserine/phosphatidylglycerophosphate/cardiolipin synthase family protein [Xanthomonas translucens]QDI02767.1 phosphatidylserine/phosphatidylglycerophosphate/cardiolipin synthase family protein [Xanthomonas translucens pv. cerealis]